MARKKAQNIPTHMTIFCWSRARISRGLEKKMLGTQLVLPYTQLWAYTFCHFFVAICLFIANIFSC